jgi:hypothetical protein
MAVNTFFNFLSCIYPHFLGLAISRGWPTWPWPLQFFFFGGLENHIFSIFKVVFLPLQLDVLYRNFYMVQCTVNFEIEFKLNSRCRQSSLKFSSTSYGIFSVLLIIGKKNNLLLGSLTDFWLVASHIVHILRLEKVFQVILKCWQTFFRAIPPSDQQ